jgi:hypothetical protein
MIIYERKISKSLKIAYVTQNDEALLSGAHLVDVSIADPIDERGLQEMLEEWLSADDNNWMFLLPDGTLEEISDSDIAELYQDAHYDEAIKAGKKNSIVVAVLEKIRKEPFYVGRVRVG